MELLSFSVEGFRAFGPRGEEIPVRKPTILTGANAGGKSSALTALGYLLDGRREATLEDRTLLYPGETPGAELVTDQGKRYATMRVTGRFKLSTEEQSLLELPEEARFRRISSADGIVSAEVLRVVPQDQDLRDLDGLGLDQLQERASRRGLEPVGRRNAKESWRAPLAAEAVAAHEAGQTVEEWVIAPRSFLDCLPGFLLFSSTEEPEPEQEIQTALREAFVLLIEDPTRVGPVRDVERELQTELAKGAEDLCTLIAKRCPELGEVIIEPEVSFRQGLPTVTIYRVVNGSRRVGLKQSGAGRRRQVNLAVWEWTKQLLDRSQEGHGDIVIAYDEPDTHLDYLHQRELMELIREQAGLDRVRMIVATHSLNLIDKVPIDDVVHLQLGRNERSKVERLLEPEHEAVSRYLARLSTSMGLRNSVLLHERCFVGVEGATEMQVLPVLFQVGTGALLQSAGIALLGGRNNIGALDVAKYLHDTGRKVAFVVDSDSLTADGSRKVFRPDKLKAAGFSDEQINFVGTAELEDVFSDAQWVSAANAAWPRDDHQDWLEDDVACLRSSGKFSSRLLEMIRTACSDGPDTKPELLLGLALRLERSEDVPEALLELFQRLIALGA